ncbi:MAG: NAD(P)(+) transhydrogenase (Re/Si-specific) subunit beta [Planctomycetota bacterium]|nr:NAD(P)(+) transhydrogenase (Re/Si-specific) subunit beta [Planctomycetota bacterium]
MDSGHIDLIYLLAACLFIAGLKMLSSPRSAPRGNLTAASGMLLAVIATVLHQDVNRFGWVIAGLVVGSAIGIYLGQTVKMTAMPQLVALFNGLGGAASAVVAWSELSGNYWNAAEAGTLTSVPTEIAVPIVLSTLIGGVTFTGSCVAFAKLQELISGRPLVYPLQKTINLVLLLGALTLGVLVVRDTMTPWPYVLLVVVSSVLGALSVVPIGGADMPVVISLLNSYSGLAACATGFVLRNNALIIGGSLVGASGIILTKVMCKAMNRSLANVLFGAFGAADRTPSPAGAEAARATGAVKSGSPEDAAMLLDAADLVIVVPGYGLAVAQAQHVVREMGDILQSRGAEVKYAVHPVAGRMPGHMNVLLAEADVPYDQLYDMEAINSEFPQAEVALVIGANDVTNPAARSDRSSPIYGMPILDVDKAQTAIVIKRSMRPGFAGVDNELYTRDRTLMVFGDAKDTVARIIHALKEI